MTRRTRSELDVPHRVLIVVEDAIGIRCAEAATHLWPQVAVMTVVSAELEGALASERPELVIRPAQQRPGMSDMVRADRVVRSHGAMFLPVLVTATEVFVGPLFGPGRSCAHCWQIRHERRDSHGSVESQGPTQEDLADPASQVPASRAPNARLAMSLVALLLERKRIRFASPYLLYDVPSRQVRRGTLTSAHECGFCRRQLRRMEAENGALKRLVQGYAAPSEVQSPRDDTV